MGPLGTQEIIFIFILALLLFGPKKLPEIGKYNAGQKRVFWGMSLLIILLLCTGLVIWDTYFFA